VFEAGWVRLPWTGPVGEDIPPSSRYVEHPIVFENYEPFDYIPQPRGAEFNTLTSFGLLFNTFYTVWSGHHEILYQSLLRDRVNTTNLIQHMERRRRRATQAATQHPSLELPAWETIIGQAEQLLGVSQRMAARNRDRGYASDEDLH